MCMQWLIPRPWRYPAAHIFQAKRTPKARPGDAGIHSQSCKVGSRLHAANHSFSTSAVEENQVGEINQSRKDGRQA